ncbi:hypothetical protein [Azospirillum sp.]|uniref:hypothetical protein n=1 Tax=Azospirillum sp. TaxID=34012 RepID=UPI002D49ECF5|nr:hypothetical protein [Azospirillum sp.]HYD67916.1 hypothetical protein [Azospirillum sp.]
MLFEFEPSGVNDTYIRLTRNGVSCILAPTDSWNGMLRVNYLVAANVGGAEPHMVFRCLDVGWDDGRFYWRGRASPVLVSSAMVEVLVDRGLVSEEEAETMSFSTPNPSGTSAADNALMLRASLMGCTFSPIYEDTPAPWRDSAPPRVVGFALRTLADPGAFILEARAGLPILDAHARAALRRHVGEG